MGSQAWSNTHRRARQTLQTSEASVTLQSPLASLSSFSFVTSGALRALEIRQTDVGWVGLGWAKGLRWPHPSQGVQHPQGPCCPPSLPLSETQGRTLKYALQFPGLQPVLRVPWGLVHPVRRKWEQCQSQARTGRALLFTCPRAGAPRLVSPRYSQLLLDLPACQLGLRGQESQGVQGLQEHPGAQSHHDHPVRREVSGSEKNGSEEARKEGPSRVTPDSDSHPLPRADL